MRELFPRPAEVQLIQNLGGTVLVIGSIRNGGRPLTLILSLGRLLRSEGFKLRDVDGTSMFINDIGMGLAIQPDGYSRDIVKEIEFDEQLKNQSLHVKWIPQQWLDKRPKAVRQMVASFI